MRDFKVPSQANRGALPLICIPTTAGTGSEATRFTVITDTERDEKMLIAGLGALPLAAVVDYELTFSLPARITADTGIDSLTHALEAFVSKRANDEADEYALRAMRLIAPNLRTVYGEPSNAIARAAMMKGATLAGIAFSNSSVALVHGMSRPIGAHFHVPHGLSNAMLLPAVTEYSLNAALPRYAEAARAMGVATSAEGDQSAAAKLLQELRDLNRDLAVPTPAAYGIDPATWDRLLPTMAAQALASGSPANNPAVPTAEEITALYRRAWAG
jgi:alcohol dehydrogenase class IV